MKDIFNDYYNKKKDIENYSSVEYVAHGSWPRAR